MREKFDLWDVIAIPVCWALLLILPIRDRWASTRERGIRSLIQERKR